MRNNTQTATLDFSGAGEVQTTLPKGAAISVLDDALSNVVVDTVADAFAIRARGISRRYGRRWALVNVSFDVPRGSATMVAGRNGSGKSTLLRVLSTAIRPDRGTATIEGIPLHEREDVRRHIALLGHYSYSYEALSSLENLQVCARLLGVDASRDAIMPLLQQVGLAERATDPVNTYSAGMRKRLSIARTLLQNASVVFLDEPYGQLDPPGFRLIDELIDHLKKRGTTILIATHMLERMAGNCNRGIVLEQGRLVWEGTAEALPRESGLNVALLNEGRA